LNSASRNNQYNDSVGTTGATSGSNFASNDPTSSGYSGNTGSGDIYNDRTGHTHSTTGQNTLNSDFQNDPTRAQTSSTLGNVHRPSLPPSSDSLLSVKSGVIGGKQK